MKLTGNIRALDETHGAVRVEDVYDTGVEDLWAACTIPDRVARWIAQVAGDLRVGGTVRLVFTSTWSGTARIEVCDAPYHLLLVTEPGTDDEGRIEVWLTAEGSRTRLVVEERGLPLDGIRFHGSGWQAHLEDLRRSLTIDGPVHEDGWSERKPAIGWHTRWSELTPDYQDPPVNRDPPADQNPPADQDKRVG